MIKINKIFVACDYKAQKSKKQIIEILKKLNLPFVDLHFSKTFIFNFNNPAKHLCKKVLKDKTNNSYGILLCGSGIGMNIQANKIVGIRSVLGLDCETIKLGRKVENINILSLRSNGEVEKYEKLIVSFFETEFSNLKRHKKRIFKFET
jgi:ribose 5-phosphate isomerase B